MLYLNESVPYGDPTPFEAAHFKHWFKLRTGKNRKSATKTRANVWKLQGF